MQVQDDIKVAEFTVDDEETAKNVSDLVSTMWSETVIPYLRPEDLAIACERFPTVESKLRFIAEYNPLVRLHWECVSAQLAARAAARCIDKVANGQLSDGLVPIVVTT